MKGSHELRVATPFAKGVPELSDEARQRRFGDERRWPEAFVQLALPQRSRTRLNQHLQQLERFRRQMDRLPIGAMLKLPAVDVEGERTE